MFEVKMDLVTDLRVLITNCFEEDFPIKEAIQVCQGLEKSCSAYITSTATHNEYRGYVDVIGGGTSRPLPFTEKQWGVFYNNLNKLVKYRTHGDWPELDKLVDWFKKVWYRTGLLKKETITLRDWVKTSGIFHITQEQHDALKKEQYKQTTKKESCEPALRYNDNKVPYAYLPLDLLDGAARVMQGGAIKYKDGENYRKGYSDLKDPLSSVMRHVESLQRAILEQDVSGGKGKLLDDESGFAHVHHVITSTLLLIHSMRLKGYNI